MKFLKKRYMEKRCHIIGPYHYQAKLGRGVGEAVAGIFCEEFLAVALGGGLYRGGTLQHWYFTALGIFSSQDIFQ